MPDPLPNSSTATITPAPLPNPVIVGGFESALERAARAGAGGPAAQGQAGIDASGLEAARARDRGERPPPVTQLTGASNTSEQRSQQDQANMLQMRPKGKEIRKSAEWDAVKNERDNAVRELEAMRAQLRPGVAPDNRVVNGAPNTQQGATPAASTTIDITQHEAFKALKAERDSFYEEIKHVRVEADPEFRAKFDSRRDAAIKIARSVAGGAGDDIARILAINDPEVRQLQLAERIKDFSEGSKQRIIAANAALVTVDVEREMEVQLRKATWDQTKSTREQAQQQQFQQRFAKLNGEFDNVLAAWSDPDKGMPFMIDDAVKARVVPVAKQIFGGESNPQQLAEASLKAALFPEVLKLAMHVCGEMERLKGTNDLYRNSYPGSEGGNFTTSNGNTPPPPIRTDTYDSRFGQGLEAARARDQGRSR